MQLSAVDTFSFVELWRDYSKKKCSVFLLRPSPLCIRCTNMFFFFFVLDFFFFFGRTPHDAKKKVSFRLLGFPKNFEFKTAAAVVDLLVFCFRLEMTVSEK